MAFHSDKTATFVVPVQPDQPPSGTAAWLREMARGSNSVNGGLVAEQQARIAGDQHLQDEIDGITSGTGIVGPPGPPGATGAAGPPGLMGPAGPSGATGATGAAGAPGASGATGATGAQGPPRIVALADTPPVSPAAGDEWYDSVGGQLYIRFNDGTSSQWVPTSNQPGPPGAAGASGPPGATGAASTVPGPPGATGATGATGSTGPTGLTGATGPAGSANMSGMVAGQFAVAASATTVTSSAMTWDAANQRLGIGTSTPGNKLDVNGGANITGPVSTLGSSGGLVAYDRTGTSDASNFYRNANVTSFYDTVLGGNVFSYTAAGNVGIGTTVPAGKLTVTGAGQATANFSTTGSLANTLQLDDSGLGAASGGAILFTANAGAWRYATIQGALTNGSTNTTGDVTISTRRAVTDATLTETARFAANGNSAFQGAVLTVGLSSSGAVQSTGAAASLRVDDRTTANYSALYRTGDVTRLFDNTAGDVISYNASGNVGIGAAGPTSRLQVVGPATAAFAAGFENPHATAGDQCVYFAAGAPGADSTSNILTFYNGGITALEGAIVRTGAVGILFYSASDARLKEQVVESRIGLQELMQLRVRQYNWKSDGSQAHGLIAQEVAEIYPMAVHRGGDDPAMEPWGIDYGRLTPLLIKSMQQQQEFIGVLQRRLAEVEARLGA